MQNDIHTVYFGLGANLGDREATLKAARDQLPPVVEIVACSGLYQTAPWGVVDQPPFINAVCEGRTKLPPLELLLFLKSLEQNLGRTSSFRWGPRSIDIDILLYDDLVLQSEQLTIPHPRLHERQFVLTPLSEIAPELQHPLMNTTMRALAAATPTAEITVVSKTW